MSLIFLDFELRNVFGGKRKAWLGISKSLSHLYPDSLSHGETGVIKLNFLYFVVYLNK